MEHSDPFLRRLMKRWPSPSQRQHTGEQIGFDGVERDLGLILPASYKQLTYAYGQGVWFQTIFVLNPFMAWLEGLEPWMSVRGYAGGPSWGNGLRASREEFPGFIRSPIYPEPGGLFPWAFLQDGGVLYWLTAGRPERWSTLHDRDLCLEEEWESFEMSVTELLWRLATGDAKVASTELDERIAPYRSTVFQVYCATLLARRGSQGAEMVSLLDTVSRWCWPRPVAKRRGRDGTPHSRVPRCRIYPKSRLVPRGSAAARADAADGPPTRCRAGHLPPPQRAEGAGRRPSGAWRPQALAARRLPIRGRSTLGGRYCACRQKGQGVSCCS
jgi:hypothetical protein